MIQDYIPPKYVSQCAVCFNLAQAFGAFVGLCIAFLLPSAVTTPVDQLMVDQTWRYIYAAPIIMYSVLALGFYTLVTTDGPIFCLQ